MRLPDVQQRFAGIVLICAAAAAARPPNFQGCNCSISQSLPYCNSSLSYRKRASLLVASLTLDEKISLMSPDISEGAPCATHSSRIDRIGLPSYRWLLEVNADVKGDCVAESRCHTKFYGPLGFAASFNRTSWHQKGCVLSREARAFRNVGWVTHVWDNTSFTGITAFGPNLNIARDPRFGRLSELPGEDPYLSGIYGADVVSGMQEEDATGRPRALAFLKHYAAYSEETGREQGDHNISHFDLHDTYLRQYELAARLGRPAGVMCSYSAVNGVPSCASSYLLRRQLRRRFGLPDAVVTSDCSAVRFLRGPPVLAASDAHAAAFALNNGTDLEMGSTLYRSALSAAAAAGLVEEDRVDEALTRMYLALMRGGLFDAFGASPHDALRAANLNSSQHRAVAWDAALQAPVLLRNDLLPGSPRQPLLPLSRGARIAVVGPMATELSLGSDYAGVACFNASLACVWPLARALQELALAPVQTEPGVPVSGAASASARRAALRAASDAEVVVVGVGITREEEHEGMDRGSTDLPPVQHTFLLDVLALGRPTVAVLVNGGQLSVDCLAGEQRSSLAVIEAFNPSNEGFRALAALLFGQHNRWGKLPYTLYPERYQREVSVDAFDMAAGPGRGYRYYRGTPLWPFGFGLSYTAFALQRCTPAAAEVRSGEDRLQVECVVANAGARGGDEVVQLYHEAGPGVRRRVRGRHPAPRRSLVAFQRLSIPAGSAASARVAFDVAASEGLALTTASGRRALLAGHHSLLVSLGTQGGSSPVPASAFSVHVFVSPRAADSESESRSGRSGSEPPPPAQAYSSWQWHLPVDAELEAGLSESEPGPGQVVNAATGGAHGAVSELNTVTVA